MRVSAAMVSSLDGRITNGDTPGSHTWASPEDQAIFNGLKQSHDLVVMGSSTYEIAKPVIHPDVEHPRVVLTGDPDRYQADMQPGIEFITATPQQVIDQAVQDGHERVLLVGGAQTNAGFFDAGLVDELYLTVEPVIFGKGIPLTQELQQPLNLELVGSRHLNVQGTMLLHYIVQKSIQE